MKRILIALVVLVAVAAALTGCTRNSTQRKANREYRLQQKEQVAEMTQLLKNQPAAYVDYSSERENLNERNVRFSDRNKISYIYLLALDGTPVAHYTVKGKVSALSSQINPDEGPVTVNSSHYELPAAEPDGSYNTNGDGIFFFTTKGAYVEWSGDYLLSDQPSTLTAPVKLVVNANARVTASKHDKGWSAGR